MPAIKTTKKKDNNRPKRSISAYNYFYRETRASLLRELPTRMEGKSRRSHGKISFKSLAREIASR